MGKLAREERSFCSKLKSHGTSTSAFKNTTSARKLKWAKLGVGQDQLVATYDALGALNVGKTPGCTIKMGFYAEKFMESILEQTTAPTPFLRAFVERSGRVGANLRCVQKVRQLEIQDSKTDLVIDTISVIHPEVYGVASINVQVKTVLPFARFVRSLDEGFVCDTWVRVHTSKLTTLLSPTHNHVTHLAVRLLDIVLQKGICVLSDADYVVARRTGLDFVRKMYDALFAKVLMGHEGAEVVVPDVHAFMAFTHRAATEFEAHAPRFRSVSVVNSRQWVDLLKADNGRHVGLGRDERGIPTIWVGGLKIQRATNGQISVYAKTNVLSPEDVSVSTTTA